MVQGQCKADSERHFTVVLFTLRRVDWVFGQGVCEYRAAGRQLANAVPGRCQGPAGDVQGVLRGKSVCLEAVSLCMRNTMCAKSGFVIVLRILPNFSLSLLFTC